MLKKMAMASLLTATMAVNAENNISYSYLELGYNTIDLDGDNADGLYFNGAFDLSDKFYLGGSFNRNSVGNFDLDRYGVFLGFHNDISDRTDFYSELNVGRFDRTAEVTITTIGDGGATTSTGRVSLDSTSYGLDVGTRTAFTPKFELISKLGYTEIDDFNDGFFNVGLKGLFKFNDHSSIALGVEYLDFEDFAASIGYRYSF